MSVVGSIEPNLPLTLAVDRIDRGDVARMEEVGPVGGEVQRHKTVASRRDSVSTVGRMRDSSVVIGHESDRADRYL